MKKMALDLDALVVESFETAVRRPARGTVRGNDQSDTTCFQIICDCPTARGGAILRGRFRSSWRDDPARGRPE